jgi:two-component system, NarL family, response regulator LiaR
MSEEIRVLLADDHAVLRLGLRTLIATEPGMTVVGEASNGAEAVEQARFCHPGVVLLDLVMPGTDGLYALERLMALDAPPRVIVFTSYAEDDKLFPAIRAGAQGYLLKETDPREVLAAIRDVAQGGSALHPAVARRVLREMSRPPQGELAEEPLTEREAEVLILLARGFSNQEIALRLAVRERTIRSHVSSILAKLHLANRTQAALYALRSGFLQLDSA